MANKTQTIVIKEKKSSRWQYILLATIGLLFLLMYWFPSFADFIAKGVTWVRDLFIPEGQPKPAPVTGEDLIALVPAVTYLAIGLIMLKVGLAMLAVPVAAVAGGVVIALGVGLVLSAIIIYNKTRSNSNSNS